ncbi:MAG: hypothetical protein NC120_09075 [Ruminococcus sp.]|nr:hypothetical protein [Ruminococcus sp.]
MKKGLTAALAVMLAILSLCGCSGENENGVTSESVSESVSVSETVLTEASTEIRQTEEEFKIWKLTDPELRVLVNRTVDENRLSKLSVDSGTVVRPIGADTVLIDVSCIGKANFRRSANVSCTDPKYSEDFYAAADSMPRYTYCDFTDYAEKAENDNVRFVYDGSGDILRITYGYSVTDTVKFNGYVRQEEDGSFSVIIDPAYMYGLPMLTSFDTEFDINGENVLMDSFGFTVQKLYTEGKDVFGADKLWDHEGYVYGSMKVNNLKVLYDILNEESLCSANGVFEFSLIEEDTHKVLETALFDYDSKNGEYSRVYGLLLDNMDMFAADDVVGVNLIDLDFDGTPELLVSKQIVDVSEEYRYPNEYADVDIYSIEEDSFKYIDTLYNNSTQVYYNGNVIGVKKDEFGGKKWFYMSRKNLDTGAEEETDYLFVLNDSRLEYTSVFESYSKGDYENDYYIYGEPLEYEEYEGPPKWDDEVTHTYHRWKHIEADSGLWELWGYIKQDYCADISPVFSLYSGWMYSKSSSNGEKIAVDSRTMEYKLANLVDAFYFGEYDPEEHNYHYAFLGDYEKPVIYLYPEEKTDVSVKLAVKDGGLTCSYPDYRDGWDVTAYPDGTLINKADGEEYYCLYWEGEGIADWDMSKGFVVKSEDTADFLRNKLKEIGLTPRESNEFIIYWLPILRQNECNLITFQTERYESSAVLDITPKPDSILRVFMVYAPCDEDAVAEPQEFPTFERTGFTAVEWGGAAVTPQLIVS